MDKLVFLLLTISIVLPFSGVRAMASGTELRISGGADSFDAGYYLETLEDRKGKLAIEDVTGPEYRDRFRKNESRISNFGFTDSVYWGRVTLKNETQAGRYVLEIGFPLLDRVEFYWKYGDEAASVPFRKSVSGRSIPFSERSVSHRNFMFVLPFMTHETIVCYMRFQTEDAMIFPVTVWQQYALAKRIQIELFVFGIYYGIIVVMLLYNIFLFLSLRDWSYLYYVLFLAFYGLFLFSMNGLAGQYLWPGSTWLSMNINPVLIGLSVFWAVFFSITFMDTKDYTPRLHLMLKISMILSICLSAGSLFMKYSTAIQLGQLLPMTVIFLGIPAAVICWRRGYRPARFYLIAWSTMLAGIMLSALRVMGVLEHNVLTEYGLQIGSGIEIVLLSLALADRINILNEEKEKAQQQAIDNLRKADSLKDEFLANTSHELRTPLNGIIGIAESLMDGIAGDLSEKARKNINLIIVSGKRLASLVNDILDFSRLKNQDIILRQKAVHLRPVSEVICELVAPLMRGKDIILVNNIGNDIPPVLADEDRLRQIMLNLVGNAIKFTERGEIQISAKIVQLRDEGVHITYSRHIAVSVRDTGIGIAPDKQEVIFQPFQQADGSISRIYGGTGIGLPISRRLVELHGGSMTVESEPGRGSTFTFSLPVTESVRAISEDVQKYDEEDAALKTEGGGLPVSAEMEETEQSVTHPFRSDNKIWMKMSRNMTILIVDDDPVNLQVLENLLSLNEYTVLTCLNGRDALSMMEGGLKPDMILLDIMMPLMSGYEVSRKLREKHSLFDLPIMMLTAKNQVADIIAGFEAGANDYLSKPFDRHELLARVGTHIILKEAVKESRKLVSIEQELEIARMIQLSTIPESVPKVKGLDVAARYIPMESVGGDFYDFNVFDDGALSVLITDVSGHGVPAALVASMVKIIFSMQKGFAGDVVSFFQHMNAVLRGNIASAFVTAIYVYIDLDIMKCSYANAGHVPLILYRKKNNDFRFVKPRGRIIGWLEDISIEPVEMDIEKGDRLILFTDGITESFNSSEEMYGFKRLQDMVEKSAGVSGDELIDDIIKDLREWKGGQQFNDDFTIVVVDVNE